VHDARVHCSLLFFSLNTECYLTGSCYLNHYLNQMIFLTKKSFDLNHDLNHWLKWTRFKSANPAYVNNNTSHMTSFRIITSKAGFDITFPNCQHKWNTCCNTPTYAVRNRPSRFLSILLLIQHIFYSVFSPYSVNIYLLNVLSLFRSLFSTYLSPSTVKLR